MEWLQPAEVPPDYFVPPVGMGMGQLPVNTRSGVLVSFLGKNHTFCHPFEGLDIGRWK
jgi:hypothetical protein